MTSTADAPEDSIQLLCDVTAVSREEAIKRLRANNNDVHRATEEYFDDPTGSKYKWDESAFGADRHGETTNPSISFNIQGPDDVGHTGYFHGSAAPTRPPSRANNRSPLGAPTTSAQEDEDLQRALAQSAAESGIPPQEAGIIDTGANAPYFGPANRPEYDSEQWAMVPTKVEMVVATEPPPSARKRDPEEPAFLRSNPDHREHRLGAIVSILHKIPLARNILLSIPPPAPSYGYNTQWWNGQVILKQEQLNAMATDGAEDYGIGENTQPDYTDEVHRLIAFLDNTERSYGSGDPLSDARGVWDSQTWWDGSEKNFFETLQLKGIENSEFDTRPMMTRVKLEPKPISERESQLVDAESDTEDYEKECALIDVDLDFEAYTWVNSLYDALDQLFWMANCSLDDPFTEGVGTAIITQPGEVMTFRFSGTGLHKPCDIPAVFYADRYTESRKNQAVFFQSQIFRLRRSLLHLDTYKENLTRCDGEPDCYKVEWLSNPHDTRDCCRKIISIGEYLLARQRKTAQWRYWADQIKEGEITMRDLGVIHTWTGPYELTEEQKDKKEMFENHIMAAKHKIESIEQELEDIELRKQDCYRCLDVVSKRLTIPEDETDAEFDEKYITRSEPDFYHPDYWNPTHKYLLRGVSTTKDITYICTRKEENLIELEAEEYPPPSDQWWRVAYTSNDPNPLKVEKTDIDSVLLAAGTETKYPILIYASEKAMKTPRLKLSDALRRFARADNRAFQQELSQEQSQEHIQEQVQKQVQNPEQTQPGVVMEGTAPLTFDAVRAVPSLRLGFGSPAKRKHSGGSSVATLGSSGDDSRDIEMTFSDEPSFFPEDDNMPRTMHREFASPTPQSNKLGGIVESLANCRTFENGQEVHKQEYAHMEEMKTFNSDQTQPGHAQPVHDSVVKAPEMQERPGSILLTKPNIHGVPRKPSVDPMDMDLDSADN